MSQQLNERAERYLAPLVKAVFSGPDPAVQDLVPNLQHEKTLMAATAIGGREADLSGAHKRGTAAQKPTGMAI